MARGGRRVGAGRKPKPKEGPNHHQEPARVLAHPSVPTTNDLPEVEEFDAPNDLSMEERKVWMRQAPFAFQNRTLTRESALSFERYCKVVVMEQHEALSSAKGGANHRGLLKQINAYELQFLLTPAGKPMPTAAKAEQPASKLSKFRR